MKKLDFRYAMRIATEHLSYRSLIEEIEGDLERVRRAEQSFAQNLPDLIESFLAQVRVHFALEERGGLFEVYRESEELFRSQAAVMTAQHRDFLERLGRSLEGARAIERPEGPAFERWAAELHALFADLRAHERAEDELLGRLVEQDIHP